MITPSGKDLEPWIVAEELLRPELSVSEFLGVRAQNGYDASSEEK